MTILKATWSAGVSVLTLIALASAVTAQEEVEPPSVNTFGDVSPSDRISAQWIVGADLYIGKTVVGSMEVVNGATVSSVNGYVSSDGNVYIGGLGPDSANSKWTNTGNLFVGANGGTIGTSRIDIWDGGMVSNETGYIEDGWVRVQGENSTWTNRGNLFVGPGEKANGRLYIEDGGVVVSTNSEIGVEAGSEGEVVVSNKNLYSLEINDGNKDSSWKNMGDLTVGVSGKGTLNVGDNGIVSVGTDSSGIVTIAKEKGSTGALNIGRFGGYTPEAAAGIVEAAEIKFGSGDGSLRFNHTNKDYVFKPIISGSSSGKVYVDYGTTVFGGENTYEGETIVTGGNSPAPSTFLRIANSKALGSTNKGTTINWADLELMGNITLNEPLTMKGGTLRNFSGNNTYSGTITLSKDSYQTIFDSDNGMLTLSGAISAEADDLGRILGGIALVGAGDGKINSTGTNLNSLQKFGEGTWALTESGTFSFSDEVGVYGGKLVVEKASKLNSKTGKIGDAISDGNAKVTVTGLNSEWLISENLVLGSLGLKDSTQVYSLEVADGGTVSNVDGSVGLAEDTIGIVTVSGLKSAWNNSGTLTVGSAGKGVLTVADGGVISALGSDVDGNNVSVAKLASSSGTINIGAAIGSSAAKAGTLNAAEVRFGSGTGTLNFNHTDTDYTFAPKISGNGEINVVSGTTYLKADSSGFSGTSTITGATLAVDEHLGGSTFVAKSGRLIGTGTLGSGEGSNVTVASGGTLAPGNSIGTLAVNGDLIVSSGARYEVEVAPGQAASDRVVVNGKATLNGGTVSHIGITGAYDRSARYTILSAKNGVTGRFDAVTSDFAFLNATLGYGEHDVELLLDRNDISFADVGETHNQRATAVAVNGLGLGNDVYNAIRPLEASAARLAFDELSGEIHASTISVLIEDSQHIRNKANERIRTVFEHTNNIGVNAWASPYGSWGAGWANNDVKTASSGIVMGIDAIATDQTRLGLLAGYGRSKIDLDAPASTANVASTHIGLYGGTQWAMPQGTLSLRAGMAYSWHSIDTVRSVGLSGIGLQTLSTGYDANTIQAFGEIGYGIQSEVARFEPFVSLAHVAARNNGFAEYGGIAALSATGASNEVTMKTIGVRVETTTELGETIGRLNGMIGWRNASGNRSPHSTHALAGSDIYSITGNPVAGGDIVLETGLYLDLASDATLGISYQGKFSSAMREHGFKAEFAKKF